MKKILFDVDVLNKHYCVYLNEETKEVNACVINNIGKIFIIRREEEIEFLNKIVKSLNKKYIKRNVINYNNGYYYRYINKYSQKSYFSKIENDKEQACSYESIKSLYDYYNSSKVLISKSSNITKVSPNNYVEYCGMNNRNNSRKSKIPIKVALSILGVGAIVVIGATGYELLSKSSLPDVSTVQEQERDVEFEESISKYEKIQKQFKQIGLENWEIAEELNIACRMCGENNDISFYYDGDKDEIIYVDGNIDKEEELDTDGNNIPDNVQQILDALKANPNLSYEEKAYIKEKFLVDFIQNSEYINTEQLIDTYSSLIINYENKPDGEDVNLEYLPHKKADGMANLELNQLTVYNTDHFEKDNKVLDHELNHFNGGFDLYEASLIDEGYTSLDINGTYLQEQLMVGMLMETFGIELINEGYYSSNLKNLIANNLVEKTGKTIEESTKETYDFLDEINTILYKTEELAGEYRNNEILMQDYKDLFDKFSLYYEANNGKKMEENLIVQVIKDEIMGTNDTQILDNKENIDKITYNKDGTVKIGIVKDEESLGYLQDGVGFIKKLNSKYRREITIEPAEKYGDVKEIFNKVNDLDFEYIGR